MKLAHVVEVTQDVSQHLVFAPPSGTCISCGANLSVHNKATLVKFFTVNGLESHDGRALQTQLGLEVLCDFSHQ